MEARFENKVVIVTGAASGIGEATARRFSAEGANMVLADRQREALEKVIGELSSDRTHAHIADVSDSRPSTTWWHRPLSASAGPTCW